MKKFLLFLLIAAQIVLFSTIAFAQVAKIVDIKGDVTAQKNASAAWEKAQVDMLLDKEAQIKTGKNSECTLTFDEELKNILTIKENSQIKIDNIKPAEIFLPEGRVFSIIENISSIERFQIKTPTAIAGVKGTGLSMNFILGTGSSILCYQDILHVQGLDQQGNTTSEKDIADGFGINIGMDGQLGELFELSSDQIGEWNEFRNEVAGLRESLTEKEGEEPAGESGSMEDLEQERQTETQNDTFQQRRETTEEESASTEGERREGANEEGGETGGGTIGPY